MIRRLLLTGLCGSALAVSACDSKPSKPVEVKVATDREVALDPVRSEVAIEVPKPQDAKEFNFADDAAGKALATLLPPAAPKSLEAESRSQPLERRLPESIADPSRMANLSDLLPARLPSPSTAKVLPHPLPDRIPLELGGLTLESPKTIQLPDGALFRVESSTELNHPAPLPVLGKPVPDRASLEDPTIDFTAKSVILETIPLRTEPDPYSKINLPDPFELRETIRFRGEVKETPDSMPMSQNVVKPK